MNNLITSFLLFVNNPEVRDTDYQIACCLLIHCHEIRQMTIQTLAEKSYVSVSTVNRFLKMYGFSRYSIFKEAYDHHVKIRHEQMVARLHQRQPEAVEKLLKATLNPSQYAEVTDGDLIRRFCHTLHEAKRLILIGSDEMIGATLRFQGDFITMSKSVLKDSMYLENRFIPEKDDLVLIFSMTGRIFDLSQNLQKTLQVNQPEIWMCGHYNFIRDSQRFLSIPEGIDEIAENMILDYYLTEITGFYAREYHYDH